MRAEPGTDPGTQQVLLFLPHLFFLHFPPRPGVTGFFPPPRPRQVDKGSSVGVQEHTSLWPAPRPSHLVHLRSQRNALRSARGVLAECGAGMEAVTLRRTLGRLWSFLRLVASSSFLCWDCGEVRPWGNCCVWHQTPPPSMRARWGVPLPSFPHPPYLILQECLPPKPPNTAEIQAL